MKKFTLCLLLAFITCATFAQKQADWWFFGHNAGLHFLQDTVVAVDSGALYTEEGCSAISDVNGNLLFYTDGINVYNSQHDTMANSGDLQGDISSTQSAIIVPQPGHPNLYYIFTMDADGGANGLKYSVVDMTLNGGLGDVMTKNVLIKAPMTEKVSGVGNADGTGVWIVSHEWGTNGFFAYLLTASGLGNAVVSNVGMVHTLSTFQNGYGQLKFSPDGKKIALAIGYQGYYELLDFDNTTGLVSNPIPLYAPHRCYGMEFSADSKKLYGTRWDTFNDLFFLEQYDISSGDSNVIRASRTTLSNNENLRQLQLGPNGKIYVAKAYGTNLMGVINFPDSAGTACDFQDFSVELSANAEPALGLPAFVQSFFKVTGPPTAGFAAGDTSICPGICVNFTDLSSEGTTSWNWTFQGANTQTSTDRNPQNICYPAPGFYGVRLIIGSNSGFDTLNIPGYVHVNGLPPISITVNVDTMQAFNGVTYQWFFEGDTIPGATGAVHVADGPGNYSVAITDANGCMAMSNPIVINAHPTGIHEIAGGGVLQVYPVPATDRLTILLPGNIIGQQDVSVLNNLGQVLTTQKTLADKNRVDMDISNLPRGFYVVRCNVEGRMLSASFVKE